MRLHAVLAAALPTSLVESCVEDREFRWSFCFNLDGCEPRTVHTGGGLKGDHDCGMCLLFIHQADSDATQSGFRRQGNLAAGDALPRCFAAMPAASSK